MGVLQDFERHLEGAVEGFFARAFRSGLQPVELAKALQRYAHDNRHVAEDGVVVPNSYRIAISPKDAERLATYGDELARELATVIERTVTEKGWKLRGPGTVDVVTDTAVSVGRYQLAGRVEAGPRPAPTPDRPAPPPTPSPPRSEQPSTGTATTVLPRGDGRPTLVAADGRHVTLSAVRHTVGRLPTCDLQLEDSTVSREHAAVVRRGDRWWVLDLGSTNGTRVNGVVAAEHPLTHGDEIEFGEVIVTYQATPS